MALLQIKLAITHAHRLTILLHSTCSCLCTAAPLTRAPLLHPIPPPLASPAIFITENGVPVPGESDMSLQAAVRDDFRVDYYR